MNSDYSKYLKYKNKYLELKKNLNQLGGSFPNLYNYINITHQEFLDLPEHLLPNGTYFDRNDPEYANPYDDPGTPNKQNVNPRKISLLFRKNDRTFAKIFGYYFDVSRIMNYRALHINSPGVEDYIASFFYTAYPGGVPELKEDKINTIEQNMLKGIYP
jgi:hypothetical protein